MGGGGPGVGRSGRVGAGRAGWGGLAWWGGGGWGAGWGWAGWGAGLPSGRGVVQTFIQPERVFVWRSQERAPKVGRIGNLEESCSGLVKCCHEMEKSGKMLEKKNSIMRCRAAPPPCCLCGGPSNLVPPASSFVWPVVLKTARCYWRAAARVRCQFTAELQWQRVWQPCLYSIQD